MLTEIELTNFRSFQSLKLSGLGRVNLIVGKNNAGKTSLLEGIALVANPKSFGELPTFFRGNEQRRYYRWLLRDGALEGKLRAENQSTFSVVLDSTRDNRPPAQLSGSGWNGHGADGIVARWQEQQKQLRIQIVSVHHRAASDLTGAFAEAVRSPVDEAQMESLLRAVDERIRSVRIDFSKEEKASFLVVDIGLSERVPLAQVGQGIYRLVAIFSELLGQKPDIAFIDEIENGIHHSVLPQVWKGIAEVSERLNLQVFATTHSAECLAAANEAFSERGSYDLRVIQLYRIGDWTEGRVLDRHLIETGVEESIELR